MLLGYARIGYDLTGTLARQRLHLQAAGVPSERIFEDDVRDLGSTDRPGLDDCLALAMQGDVLVVHRLERLARDVHDLVKLVQELEERGVGLRVLAGEGANIDTTSDEGHIVLGIFAALAELDAELARERARASLARARERGRKGGRPRALNEAKVRHAQAAMMNRDMHVADLCEELGITKATLYRYVGPRGELRERGRQVLGIQR